MLTTKIIMNERSWTKTLDKDKNALTEDDVKKCKDMFVVGRKCKAVKGKYRGTMFRVVRHTAKQVDVR